MEFGENGGGELNKQSSPSLFQLENVGFLGVGGPCLWPASVILGYHIPELCLLPDLAPH